MGTAPPNDPRMPVVCTLAKIFAHRLVGFFCLNHHLIGTISRPVSLAWLALIE